MKRWSVLGLVLLLVLVMSVGTGFAAKRTVELSFWTFVQVHADFFAERVAAFNETRDDIEVKLDAVVYPYAEMHDKLLRSEEHTSELQSRPHLVCRLLLEKKKKR